MTAAMGLDPIMRDNAMVATKLADGLLRVKAFWRRFNVH